MRRNQFRSLLLIVLLISLGMVSGFLTQILPLEIQDSLRTVSIFGLSYRWIWGLAIAFVVLLTVGVTFIKERLDSNHETQSTAVLESEDERTRREFLTDLLRRYEERRLHKLDGRSELPLIINDGSENSEKVEDAGQYLIRRFEREGRLLLAGKRGSGKTMLLLKLAIYLLEKAQIHPNEPLPVILNLASWSQAYAHFNDWVTDMLSKGYGLSSKSAKNLLDPKRVVLLLDGLDELARNEKVESATKVRVSCLASICKALYHGSMSAVICCRLDELDLLHQDPSLQMPWAVELTVQELTPVQIDRALIRASGESTDRFAVSHLNSVLGMRNGTVYEETLSTPFYFTTALQVFDATIEPVIDASNTDKLERSLVLGFIEKKLQITKNVYRFKPAATLNLLTWLAVFMKERVTFELSDLQPASLRHPRLYWAFFSLFTGLFAASVTGLHSRDWVVAVICGLFFSSISAFMITDDFSRWTLVPLRRWRTWIISLVFAFVAVPASLLFILISRIVTGGLLGGLLVSDEMLLKILLMLALIGVTAFLAAIGVHLFIRALTGLAGGVPISQILTEDFGHWTLVTLLHWDAWRRAVLSGLEGGLAGSFIFSVLSLVGAFVVFIYLAYLLVTGGVLPPQLNELFATIFITPIIIIMLTLVGFLIGLLIAFPMGILRAFRQTDRFVSIHSPYQRLRAGIIFNIVQLEVVGWIFFILNKGSWHELKFSSFFPPTLALPLFFGLVGLYRTPMIKHLTLRLCLRLEGAMPLRYAGFLNYAADLGILEREGGQWRFRHEILQAHFAERGKALKERTS